MLIDRFLALLPRPGAHVGDAAAAIGRFASTRQYNVCSERFVLAFRSEGKGASGPATSAPGPRHYVHVLPGTARSDAAGRMPGPEVPIDDWLRFADRRLRIFNLVHCSHDSFELASDPLGIMRCYRAEVPGGLVVASSIHDLLCCFPALTSPADPLGVLAFLGTTACGFERTVHARVKRVLAGAVVTWRPESGPRTDRRRRILPSAPDVGLDMKRASDRVVSVLADDITDCVQGARSPVIGLTGGFDSRLIAAVAKDHDIPIEGITVGLPSHMEVRVAKRVAAALGIGHRVVRPTRDALAWFDVWRDVLEGQFSLGTAFICDLLDTGYSPGTPFLHGFLGDTVGSGFQNWGAPDMPNGAAIARAIVQRSQSRMSPDFPALLGLDVPLDGVVSDVEASLADIEPYQSLALWGIEQRQAGGIASMLTLIGQHYHPCPAYYSADAIQAWLSLPRFALEGKRLMRELLADRWPAIGTMPHAEKQPHLLPRGRHATAVVAGMYLHRVRRAAERRIRGSALRADPTYIWHLWHGVTDAQRAHYSRRLVDLRDAAIAMLDYEVPRGDGAPPWQRASVSKETADVLLGRMFLLFEYCAWLQETVL